MHKVSARLTLLVMVIVGGVVAAPFLRYFDRQAIDLNLIEHQLTHPVDRPGDPIVGL